jgi:hypothetical protein
MERLQPSILGNLVDALGVSGDQGCGENVERAVALERPRFVPFSLLLSFRGGLGGIVVRRALGRLWPYRGTVFVAGAL